MSVGRRVAAVAAAFLLAPGSALAADLGAPLQGVTETLPVVVPEVSVPISTAAPEPAVPAAVPAVAAPAVETARAVAPIVAQAAETAPNVQDSPQLDAAPVSRAPARAVRPQPSTERPARVAVAPKRPVKPSATVAAPLSEYRVVEETRAPPAAEVSGAPLQLPPTPTVPSAGGVSSASAGANLLAFVALLVAIFLLAVPELGASAPLAPLLRRRFHVFSLLERPG